MEEELNLGKPISLKALVIAGLIIFLVGGFVMGFALGGKYVHDNWEGFFEIHEERIERDCTCFNKTTQTEDLGWILEN